MATVVLLHGSWFGGWCWRDVAGALRRQGHTVLTPSLSGCAEHYHHAAADVTLNTHVDDIEALLFYEDLRDVVLVGHSYAGLVLQALANRDCTRLAGLYYLDSYVLPAGKKGFDLWAPERVQEARRAIAAGNPFRPPIDANLLSIDDPVALNWVVQRLRPHPLGTYEIPMNAPTPAALGLPRLYVNCTQGATVPMFAPIVAWVREQGWPIQTLEAPHCAMVTHAQEVASSIHQFATGMPGAPSTKETP